jgi:hypothetical protein
MQLRRLLVPLSLWCCFILSYAVAPAQDRSAQPQTRPAPGGPPSGGRPPGGGNSGGGRPNPGGPQIQPVPGPSRPQPPRPNPPRPNPPSRPNPGRPTIQPVPGPRPPRPPVRPGRPPSWGRPPASRPTYGWRPNDRAWLHRYYLRNLSLINMASRPRFVVGGFFPYAYIPYITTVPPNVYGYLPPPPPGYQIGYYQGYVVVYDPVTYFIANVIDLMQ